MEMSSRGLGPLSLSLWGRLHPNFAKYLYPDQSFVVFHFRLYSAPPAPTSPTSPSPLKMPQSPLPNSERTASLSPTSSTYRAKFVFTTFQIGKDQRARVGPPCARSAAAGGGKGARPEHRTPGGPSATPTPTPTPTPGVPASVTRLGYSEALCVPFTPYDLLENQHHASLLRRLLSASGPPAGRPFPSFAGLEDEFEQARAKRADMFFSPKGR